MTSSAITVQLLVLTMVCVGGGGGNVALAGDCPNSVQLPTCTGQPLPPIPDAMRKPTANDRRFVGEDPYAQFPSLAVPGIHFQFNPGEPDSSFGSGRAIDVDRYVGETTEIGFDSPLKPAVIEKMVENGLLHPIVKLKFALYHCASGTPGELKLRFNGEDLPVVLEAPNGGWKMFEFDVPISLVNFPEKGILTVDGFVVSPLVVASNLIEVHGGTIVNKAGNCEWVSGMRSSYMAWASLEIRTVSPVVLVHGNGSWGGYWHEKPQHFSSGTFAGDDSERGLKARGWPWGALSFHPAHNSFEANAEKLAHYLANCTQILGVDSVHLVGHSKGGLDITQYLNEFYYKRHFDTEPDANSAVEPFGERDGRFSVLSVTTIGSPHYGSILADLTRGFTEYSRGLFPKVRPVLLNFPFGTFTTYAAYVDSVEKLGWAVGKEFTDEGTKVLNIDLCRTFTRERVKEILERKVRPVFYVVASDMDRDGDQSISDSSEYAGFLISDDFANLNSVARTVAANRLYAINRDVKRITVREVARPFPNQIYAVRYDQYAKNDGFVTQFSALGRDIDINATTRDYNVLVKEQQIWEGALGRDHSNISDARTSAIVQKWMLTTERESNRGDLNDNRK